VRDERFPWPLGALLVILIVGGLGFWLGSSSVAPVIVPVAAPAPVQTAPVYPAYAPQGGGFPIFGLLFGLFVLFVIFKVIRHAAWSGAYGHGRGMARGRRGWYAADTDTADPSATGATGATWPRGRAFWANKDVPPMVDEMFQRWHARMHTDAPPTPDAGTGQLHKDDDGGLTIPLTEP
jgi:hypothetical protein